MRRAISRLGCQERRFATPRFRPRDFEFGFAAVYRKELKAVQSLGRLCPEQFYGHLSE